MSIDDELPLETRYLSAFTQASITPPERRLKLARYARLQALKLWDDALLSRNKYRICKASQCLANVARLFLGIKDCDMLYEMSFFLHSERGG